MEAEIQNTKTYHLKLDEIEMLELIAELATVDAQMGAEAVYTLHNMHLVLKSLE